MIIIFSNNLDLHTKSVASILVNEYIHPIMVLDISKLTVKGNITNYYTKGFAMNIFYNNKKILIDKAKSFWWRRPQPISIHPTVKNTQHRYFAKMQWKSIINGIWMTSNSFWINKPSNDSIASNKLYQLYLAKKMKFLIPETLITNDSKDVIKFWKKHGENIIFKPFYNTLDQWRETRPLKRKFLKYIDSLKIAPCIFQKFISNAYDIRVTTIGSKIFSASTKPSPNYPYDWRMSRVKWEKHQLPDGMEKKILDFTNILGLEFCTFDFKLTLENKYYFLEINPAGQYLFIENDTGFPISKTLAEHLIRGKQN